MPADDPVGSSCMNGIIEGDSQKSNSLNLAKSTTSGSRLTFESRRDSHLTGCMRVWRMRTGISITLKPADRRRLKALARDRNAPHKQVWRAEIVLLELQLD